MKGLSGDDSIHSESEVDNPTLKIAIVEKQLCDLKIKSRDGSIKDLYKHFMKVDGYFNASKNFYLFLRQQYFGLFSSTTTKFDPLHYQIDDQFETETSDSKENCCSDPAGKSFYDHDGKEEYSSLPENLRGVKTNISEPNQIIFSPSRNSQVKESQRNDVATEGQISCQVQSCDGSFMAQHSKIHVENGFENEIPSRPIEYPHECIKSKLRRLLSICDFPPELASTDDLQFDLEIVSHALISSLGKKLEIIHQRCREITFLRNLVREAREDWNQSNHENKCLKGHLLEAGHKITTLVSEIDKLQEEVSNLEANSKVVESREKRFRLILDNNLQVHQKLSFLESPGEARADPERRARLYNYQLTKQEEINEELKKELEKANSDLQNRTYYADKYYQFKAKVEELEEYCQRRGEKLAWQKHKVERSDQLEKSLFKLKEKASQLTEQNSDLTTLNEQLRLQLENRAADTYQENKSSDLFKQRLKLVENKYLECAQRLKFYQEEYDRLISLERDSKRRTTIEHNEYQRKLFEQQVKNEQLVVKSQALAETVEFYKDKLDQLQENFEFETTKKSKHERFKEAFLGSSLFVRSKSAGVTVNEVSSAILSSPTRQMTACSLPAPRKSRSLTGLEGH